MGLLLDWTGGTMQTQQSSEPEPLKRAVKGGKAKRRKRTSPHTHILRAFTCRYRLGPATSSLGLYVSGGGWFSFVS